MEKIDDGAHHRKRGALAHRRERRERIESWSYSPSATGQAKAIGRSGRRCSPCKLKPRVEMLLWLVSSSFQARQTRRSEALGGSGCPRASRLYPVSGVDGGLRRQHRGPESTPNLVPRDETVECLHGLLGGEACVRQAMSGAAIRQHGQR